MLGFESWSCNIKISPWAHSATLQRGEIHNKRLANKTFPPILRYMSSKFLDTLSACAAGMILLRTPRSVTLREDFGLHHVTPARFAFLQLPHPHDAFLRQGEIQAELIGYAQKSLATPYSIDL